MNIIDDILTACLASARAPPIVTKQNGKMFNLRSQVHVIMTIPPGGGKTSGFLENLNNVVKAGDISKAGLLGSVNGKTGDLVVGTAYQGAGKVVWIDEYQRMGNNVRTSLLSLIETSQAQRSLGFNLKDNIRKRCKYGALIGKKGTGHFDLVSRFSCLLTGTVKPSVHKQNYLLAGVGTKAWVDAVMFLQRFMHVNLILDDRDYYKVIRGEPLFKVKDYSQFYTEQVVMDDYLDIVKWHEELTSGEDFKFLEVLPAEAMAFKSRNCLDIVRMEAVNRAVSKTMKKPVFAAWTSMKKHVAYSLFNVVANSLSFSEYKVFMNLLSKEQKTQEQIAREIGISQPMVSKIENKLIECKLLDGNKIKEKYNIITKNPL